MTNEIGIQGRSWRRLETFRYGTARLNEAHGILLSLEISLRTVDYAEQLIKITGIILQVGYNVDLIEEY